MRILRYEIFISKFIITEKEDKNFDETSWTKKINGKDVTISISDVIKYLDDNNVGVIEIPVDEIKEKCIHRDKRDKETINRSEKSNLLYPILICKLKNGKWGMIIDGHHRLLKAINNGVEYIKARVIDLSTAPYEYTSMFS